MVDRARARVLRVRRGDVRDLAARRLRLDQLGDPHAPQAEQKHRRRVGGSFERKSDPMITEDQKLYQQARFDEVAKWLETHRDRLDALRGAYAT